MYRNDYPHMVLDELVQRVRHLHNDRARRLGQIETRSQAQEYRQQVRAAIRRAFAPIPPKTPLNARVTGVIERPTHRIEKIIFESRPGCLVTANLYLPHELTKPAPCVLGACGHSEPGKACDLYQGFCQRLVRSGFVVLIYDPFSQGERDQYHGSPYRKQVGWGTRAHNMMGKQLELLGEFFGMWRAWDGIRALDYLLSRPEVDPTHVGLTGNSGGGTMTTWLWAIEDRFTMAAPSCFITTFLHNLENELPADCEQCPPGVIGAGLEMADFMIASAPKPVLLLGQSYDFFDRRGLREAYQEVRHFYQLLGAPEENVGLFIGPHGHGYYKENQQAMVEFFARHAGLTPVPVDETEVLDEETLFAAPQGQVINAGATPIHKMIATRARELKEQRPPLTPDQLREVLSRLLAIPAERGAPYYRVLRPLHREEQILARYAVETEGHIRAILWQRVDSQSRAFVLETGPRATLYLPHLAAEKDLLNEPLAAMPFLFALDVRGLGASTPAEEYGGFFQPYGMDYMFHAYYLMLGESYLGRRVYDVLRTLDLLADLGAKEIHLYGRGQGSLLALFAALLHPAVTQVTLKNAPRSFHEWTQTPYVTWPTANFVRGALIEFDLPDCIRALGNRVQVIEPWGPEMQPEAEA